jgi:hypothetical protein
MVKRRTVKHKPPSAKAKKTIVKGVIKDQSALSKDKKKKFQAALGRLNAAMMSIPTKKTTGSDAWRPSIPIDDDQGAQVRGGTVGCIC